MDRDDVLAVLSRHRAQLSDLAVKRLALFGSFARGEARPDSDVDILVELDRTESLFEFAGVKEYLEGILGRSVDLVMRAAVIEELKEYIYREAVDVP